MLTLFGPGGTAHHVYLISFVLIFIVVICMLLSESTSEQLEV